MLYPRDFLRAECANLENHFHSSLRESNCQNCHEIKSPSALANSVVEALKDGPLDLDELLRDLRRRRTTKSAHILDSDVAMVLAYLRYRGVIIEEAIDRTARTLEVLKARPSKSKHLGPCPPELKQGVVRRSLVSLYSQRLESVPGDRQGSSVRQRRLVPVGALCLRCQYHRIDPEGLMGRRQPAHT